jgi:hypothetical protein
MRAIVVGLGYFAITGCGPTSAGTAAPIGPAAVDGAAGGGGGTGGSAGASDAGGSGGGHQPGCADDIRGCYTVYAHSDHVLYHVDLVQKTLITVGPFRAPSVRGGTGSMQEDVITDLAVRPDGAIFVISHTTLYTASASDGHVTTVGPVTACGQEAVAMTFAVDDSLYAADHLGAFCQIDLSRSPPSVTMLGTLGGGLALAGDLVAVADGTMFGTAYRLADHSGSGTDTNNLLVKIDPRSGRVTQMLGQTGFPKLFGTAFSQGKVFGFTHDGSGHVTTIDIATGQGTLYGTFMDPATGRGIAFAGAGVNAMVPIVPLAESALSATLQEVLQVLEKDLAGRHHAKRVAGCEVHVRQDLVTARPRPRRRVDEAGGRRIAVLGARA